MCYEFVETLLKIVECRAERDVQDVMVLQIWSRDFCFWEVRIAGLILLFPISPSKYN